MHIKPAKGRGKVVRTAREKLKLSQAGLARELGVAISTVSNWERGAVEIPLSRFGQLRLLLSEKEGRLVKPLV